ncbi:ALA-interacting subunit 3 [Asimina triloba]
MVIVEILVKLWAYLQNLRCISNLNNYPRCFCAVDLSLVRPAGQGRLSPLPTFFIPSALFSSFASRFQTPRKTKKDSCSFDVRSSGGGGGSRSGWIAGYSGTQEEFQEAQIFTQQELPACKPILTPRWVISAFALITIVFIPIGAVSLLASRDVVEVVYRYETECLPEASRGSKDAKLAYIQDAATDKSCIKNITVPKHMKEPIYVYYQLDNFYQNHRRYVKSRSDEQLRKDSKANSTSSCDPEDKTEDGSPIVPCGLIAWSLFNDSYSFTRNNQTLNVNKQGISWKSDRDHKFGDKVFPKNFQNGTLIGGGKLDERSPLSKQENLIVWMRTAALPTFRKLYGKIEVNLEENDVITVVLENNYNTYSFSGKKKLVLSTTTWLGGKNDFLGIAYLTVGGLCFFLAATFTVVYLFKPR